MLRLLPFMGYRDSVLADSPRVYLPFTGDSLSNNLGSKTGVTVADSGGFNWGAGIADRAPDFTGPSTAAHVTYSLTNDIFNGTTWAVEAWFKRNTSQTDYSTILYTAGGNSQIQILLWNNSGGDSRKVVTRWKNTSGVTQEIKSIAGVTDTNWHHIVLTTDGTTMRMYLDGTQQGTGTHYTQTFSSSDVIRLGSYGTGSGQENMFGAIDEVALYNTNLSSTRVSAHYAARLSVDGGYAAQASTATGLVVDPIVRPRKIVTNFDNTVSPFTKTGAATVSTASGDLVITTVGSQSATLTLNNMTFVQGGEILYRLSAGGGTKVRPFFGSYTVDIFTTGNRWLRARHAGANIEYRLWNVGTTEPTTWTTFASPANAGVALSGGINFLYTSTDNSTTTVSYLSAHEEQAAILPDASVFAEVGTANGSVVNANVSVSGNATIIENPGAASGQMNTPSVEGSFGPTVAVTPATAGSLMVNPLVEAESHPDVAFSPAPFSGSGLMVQAGLGANLTTAPANGSGVVVDASVTAEKNAVVRPGPITASGYMEAPAEARAAGNDPYFNRIVGTTDNDDRWYRLDETGGSLVKAYVGGSGDVNPFFEADLRGAYSFGVFGPEGRRAIHFNSGYLEEVGTKIVDEFTFEAVIRTTQKDGMLAYGLDDNPTSSLGAFRNTIYLKDGKVTVDFLREGILSGVKDVADGEWHHIVVSFGYGNDKVLDNGYRVYVDGKLDIRRAQANSQPRIATPDFYFGVGSTYRLPGHPGDFVGDVMEVVFRTNRDLVQHDIQRLYYDVFGITPVVATPATSAGLMGDAKGKGNQKRALVLYFSTNNRLSGLPDTAEREFNPTRGDFEFGPLIETPGMGNYVEKLQAAGYRLFFKSVDFDGINQYKDYVTDLPRLLDFQQDLDMDSYDMVLYRNFPDEGTELDRLITGGFTPADLERHLESLRTAVDGGVSLWVSSPSLANRLGVIARAEFISTLKEHKFVATQGPNQIGNFDDHSAAIDPWQAVPAIGFRDTHRNNRERVVASIEGLTDIPAEIILDAIQWDMYQVGSYSNKFSLKFAKRPNGLLIGDEYVEPTMWWNDISEDEFFSIPGDDQYLEGMYAVPASAVLAGTPVTKLAAYTWQEGNTQVANPYADYVGTIVVQPGDSLKGRPVGGKILVTLSEDPRFAMFDGFGEWRRQLVPANEQINNPVDHEGADKRAWDYSMNRILFGSAGGVGKDVVTSVQNADGSTSYSVQQGTEISGVNLSEKYPTEKVTVLSMIQRGMRWLAERVTTQPGEKNIRPSALVAHGSMPNPTVMAEKSVTVNVQAAVANAQMSSPDEVADPDVKVLALPASGSGEMVNYERKIVVAPFEGSGYMTENAEVVAQRETIVVYLLQPEQITLYMEDN